MHGTCHKNPLSFLSGHKLAMYKPLVGGALVGGAFGHLESSGHGQSDGLLAQLGLISSFTLNSVVSVKQDGFNFDMQITKAL